MNERNRLVQQIETRVRETVCATWSMARGDTVEGRISQDDLDALVLLALTPGDAVPPRVTAIISRKASE